MSSDGVKFIRVNGRVIPVKGKGSAPKGKGISKRYGKKTERPKINKFSVGTKAALVAGGTSLGAYAFGRKSTLLEGLAGAALGAAAGLSIGASRWTKRGRGESKMQMANRVAASRVPKFKYPKKQKTGAG